MPSAEHESSVALAKLDPDLVAWLLVNLFDYKVPAYHHARTEATDVRVLVPRTYHADGIVLFCDAADRPLLATVLEVQRRFPALAEALRSVGPNRAILYYDVVLAGLPVAARARWEAFMTTAVEDYRSELLRDLAARNQEIGEARGEGRAVLTVLEARSVPVPIALREQILACTDLTKLETWLRRALTATSAADVIRE